MKKNGATRSPASSLMSGPIPPSHYLYWGVVEWLRQWTLTPRISVRSRAPPPHIPVSVRRQRLLHRQGELR